MAQRLAKELWDAARNEGKAVSVREQTTAWPKLNRRSFAPLSGKVLATPSFELLPGRLWRPLCFTPHRLGSPP